MMRTRRSILRTASATAATALGAGAVAGTAAASDADGGEPVERSFIQKMSESCGDDGDEAGEATRWGRIVLVSGRRRAPTPCHEPVIADAVVEDGTLVVTVGTEAPDEGGCVTCVGAIEYLGYLKLSKDAAVDDVEVVHGDGGSEDPVEDAQIETVDAGCRSEEPPVTPDEPVDGTVEFAGRMTTPTPCYEAVLDDVSVDGTTLVVTVGAKPNGSEVCVQCVGSITYEGTVDLADGARIEDVEVVDTDPRTYSVVE